MIFCFADDTSPGDTSLLKILRILTTDLEEIENGPKTTG